MSDEEKFAAKLKGLAYTFNDLTSRGKLENEEDVKSAVIERFLKIAGWDVSNPDEIKKELPVEGGKVDYALKVDDEIRLIIEAKALEKDLEKGFDQTKGKGKRTYEEQAINYAYNNGVKWVLLTNGREWRLYNAYWEGTNKDRLAFNITIEEFERKASKLALLRRKAVVENQLDIKLKLRPLRKPVDEEVVEFLLSSRKALTESVYKNNKDMYDIDMLREGIQRILDRLVFFKICEDRDILEFGRLRDTFEFFKGKMLSKDSFVQGLKIFFRDFDNIYNGEMFASHPSEDFVVTNEVYEKIIKGLYKYDFATINVDILGRIYENYLGNTLQEIEKHGVEWITAPKERKKYGQYYTPQYVVDFIVSNIGLTKDSKVLDAACGSGAFLIKAYDRLKDLYEEYNEEQRKKASNKTIATDIKMIENINSEILKRNVFGVDFNPEAIELTKINLWLRSIQKDTKLNNLDANIKCGNSLISGTEEELEKYFENPVEKRPFNWENEFKEVIDSFGFDMVIGNPPYVRIQTLPKDEVSFFNNLYRSPLGSYDIYILFIEKAVSILKDRGMFGFIMPTKFFHSNYGEKIRKILLDKCIIRCIVDFGTLEVFADVTTYPCIFIFSKEKAEGNLIKYVKVKKNPSRINDYADIIRKKSSFEDENICLFEVEQDKLESKSWIFASPDEMKVLKKLQGMEPKLGDIAERIFQGVITSADPVYLFEEFAEIDKSKVKVYSKSLQKEVVIEKELLKEVVRSGSIGRYYAKPTCLVLFPYNVEKGEATLIRSEKFKVKYPLAWQYLKENKELLENRERGKFKDDYWYRFGRTQNLGLWEQSKIMVPYMIMRLSAYPDSIENYYFVNVTTGGYGILLEDETFSKPYLIVLLNSRLLDFYLKMVTTNFRGGYFAANKQYIEQLPIKPAPPEVQAEFATLADKMLDLNKQHSGINTDFSRYLGLRTIVGESELRDFLDPLDVANKEVLNDANVLKATIKKVDIKKQGDWLVFKADLLDRGSEFKDVEVLKCRFSDRNLGEFIYYCIKNLKKKNLGKGFILQKLRGISLPKFSSNPEENRGKIDELMVEYLKAVNEKEKIEKKISETDQTIDQMVYRLYGFTEDEIKVVEESS